MIDRLLLVHWRREAEQLARGHRGAVAPSTVGERMLQLLDEVDRLRPALQRVIENELAGGAPAAGPLPFVMRGAVPAPAARRSEVDPGTIPLGPEPLLREFVTLYAAAEQSVTSAAGVGLLLGALDAYAALYRRAVTTRRIEPSVDEVAKWEAEAARKPIERVPASPTPAEQRALAALHRWLHDPRGDCDLIEGAQDFHAALEGAECERLEREAAQWYDAAVGVDPDGVVIMHRGRVELGSGHTIDLASLWAPTGVIAGGGGGGGEPTSIAEPTSGTGGSGTPSCDRCGMTLARYHGPGIEDHGFTCVRCDAQP